MNIKSIFVILNPSSLMEHQMEFLNLMAITAKFIGKEQRDEEATKAVEKARVYCQISLGPTNSNSKITSHAAFTEMCF